MLELKGLKQFFKHVGGFNLLEDDLAIRLLDEIDYAHDFGMFRHQIYAISVYTAVRFNPLATSPVLNSDKPILFFKIPYQVLSAESTPFGATSFYVAFTEAFLAKSKFLPALIADMPFLRLGQEIPFELEPEEASLLRGTFDQLLAEYTGTKSGRIDMIATHLQVYLLQIKRIYERQYGGAQPVVTAGSLNDLAIAGRFQRLLDDFFKEMDATTTSRNIAYYADKLAIHPNHLNAAVKRATGKTAHELLHEHLLALAKMLLSQTRLTAKEIAYQLAFKEPAHFANFFKKYTATTPMQFRQLSSK